MQSAPRLLLASASPRRSALLEQAGLPADRILAADIDETPHPKESPLAYAERIARQKAEAVQARLGNEASHFYLLSADTVVTTGTRILGKAEDEATARRFLRLLSGKRHRVHTALCLITPQGRRLERCVTSLVAFKRLEALEIEEYIASGEWRGKAGGYAIQGLAGAYIRWMSGSYTNIVGLPLYETRSLLLGAGYSPAPRNL
jgi:septum formation protein